MHASNIALAQSLLSMRSRSGCKQKSSSPFSSLALWGKNIHDYRCIIVFSFPQRLEGRHDLHTSLQATQPSTQRRPSTRRLQVVPPNHRTLAIHGVAGSLLGHSFAVAQVLELRGEEEQPAAFGAPVGGGSRWDARGPGLPLCWCVLLLLRGSGGASSSSARALPIITGAWRHHLLAG